jgi:hypothetical protein
VSEGAINSRSSISSTKRGISPSIRPIFLVERTSAERSFEDRVLLVGGGIVRGSGGGYACDAITDAN